MSDQKYFWELLEKKDLLQQGIFKPFRLTFRLASPICLTNPWMYFDGLMSHLLLFYGLGEEYFLLPKKQILKFPPKWMKLPFKKTGSIYHASVSQLIPDVPVKTTNIYKRFETGGSDNLNMKKVYRGSGYFRDYILRQPIFAVRYVNFFGNGDIVFIGKLLDELIVGLGNDFRIGFGLIRDWEIEETEEDMSLIWQERAMRPIPIQMCARYEEVVSMSFCSPYWDPRNVTECVPPGGMCVLK